ncbi:MAG: hypothetical protein AB7P40_00310 [Chloroflexota bacterium]
MGLKYTGRADPFVYDGVAYHPGDIVPIPQAQALRMASRTNLHSFTEVPDPPPAKPTKPAND